VSIAVLLLEDPLMHKAIIIRRQGECSLFKKKTLTKNGRLRYSMEKFVNIQFDHQLLLCIIKIILCIIMTCVLSVVFLAEFSVLHSMWYLTKYVRANL
jgi:hypothetical protein